MVNFISTYFKEKNDYSSYYIPEINSNLKIIYRNFNKIKYSYKDIILVYEKLLNCCSENEKNKFVKNSKIGSVFWCVSFCVLILELEDNNPRKKLDLEILKNGLLNFNLISKYFNIEKLSKLIYGDSLLLILLYRFVFENHNTFFSNVKAVEDFIFKNTSCLMLLKESNFDLEIIFEMLKCYKLILSGNYKYYTLHNLKAEKILVFVFNYYSKFKENYIKRVLIKHNKINFLVLGKQIINNIENENLNKNLSFNIGLDFNNDVKNVNFSFKVVSLYSENSDSENLSCSEYLVQIYDNSHLVCVLGFNIFSKSIILINYVSLNFNFRKYSKINPFVFGLKFTEIWAKSNEFELVLILDNLYNFKDVLGNKNGVNKVKFWLKELNYKFVDSIHWNKSI